MDKIKSDEIKNLSEIEYLEKFGINMMLEELIEALIEETPEDPIIFMQAFFSESNDDLVKEAGDVLSQTNISLPLFQRHLKKSFSLLASAYDKGKLNECFDGKLMNIFLMHIISLFNKNVYELFYKRYSISNTDIITLVEFEAYMTILFTLQDTYETSIRIFEENLASKTTNNIKNREVLGKSNGIADEDLCALLEQLKYSIEKTKSGAIDNLLMAFENVSVEALYKIKQKSNRDALLQSDNPMKMQNEIDSACVDGAEKFASSIIKCFLNTIS